MILALARILSIGTGVVQYLKSTIRTKHSIFGHHPWDSSISSILTESATAQGAHTPIHGLIFTQSTPRTVTDIHGHVTHSSSATRSHI